MNQTRVQVELSLAIALAVILSFFKLKLPHLLYGGSVSLESLPLFIAALRHGMRRGMLAGSGYGVVNFSISPYFLHPIQVFLDYPLAYAAIGLVVLFVHRERLRENSWFRIASGITIAESVRLTAHVVSGIIYFGHLAPEGTPVWHYSLVYNASYLVPEYIIALIALPILIRRVQ